MLEQKSEIPNNNVPIKLIIKIADFGIWILLIPYEMLVKKESSDKVIANNRSVIIASPCIIYALWGTSPSEKTHIVLAPKIDKC